MAKSLQEIREEARKILKGDCNVCPVCDGERCPAGIPGIGGVGAYFYLRQTLKEPGKKKYVMVY